MEDVSDNFPQQRGFDDCGIFAAKGIEFESEGLLIDFAQSNVDYFRKRMVIELIHGYLLVE